MGKKGFGIPLNEDERSILKAFGRSDLLVWPDVTLGVGEGEGSKLLTINGLKKKGLIKGERPWKLTSKGKRLRDSL